MHPRGGASRRAAGVALALALSLAAASALVSGCGGGSGGSSPQGTLILNSTPPGAEVFINGTDTGKQTPVQLQRAVAAAGSQLQVVMRLSGYDDASQTVTLGGSQTVTVDLTMLASRPPSVPPYNITGKVTLPAANGTTTPATDFTVTATDSTNTSFPATVVTAGATAGTYYIFAPPGAYQIVASQTGYQSQTAQVTLISADDVHSGVDLALTR